MTHLSLFTGGGGAELALKLLDIEVETIGYVEFDKKCQQVIRQRQDDGLLGPGPIFGDIGAFIDQGYARRYRGVDLITAGFPCQPFSVAGKQVGEDDPRNMWPATFRVIQEVRPGRVFLENVRGLISSGYFGTILSDLAQGGYDPRWITLSAADVGAWHRRERLWIMADAKK